jgi:hypothetical protein
MENPAASYGLKFAAPDVDDDDDVSYSAPWGDLRSMNAKRFLLVAALLLLAVPGGSVRAGGVGVGVYIGGPYYYRPYYYRPYYYYYPPTPIVVAPAPAPVVVQPPATQAPATATIEAVPAPSSPGELPLPRPAETRGEEIDQLLQHLKNPDDKVRADVAIRLGRLKARRAAEPLEKVLATDRSPDVRDAAARALGLIGMPASIPALQHAAQSDDDRGVRASAQFAVDVIRSR